MLCLLYIIFTLCVGDLGVNIVNGLQPEVDYLEKVGKNKLNFGYGVNFKFNGEIHNNLDRVWVVQKFNLPKELNNYVKGKKIGLDCSYKHIRITRSFGKVKIMTVIIDLISSRICASKLNHCLNQLKKEHFITNKS